MVSEDSASRVIVSPSKRGLIRALVTPVSNKPPPDKPFTIYSIYFYNIYFLATWSLRFFSFLNIVLQVRQAALIDLQQACEYRFTE
jgi:hypothetical protein